MMGDLRNPKWMYLKACLLLAAGVLAAGLILVENPTLRTAALLAVAIWGFCRAYYFAFYVVQHYIDPQFKFAGLFALSRYLISSQHNRDQIK